MRSSLPSLALWAAALCCAAIAVWMPIPELTLPVHDDGAQADTGPAADRDVPAGPVEPERGPRAQAILVSRLFAPEASSAPPEQEQRVESVSAAWLRLVGTVRLDGGTVHYFADDKAHIVLRVGEGADAEAEWAVVDREANAWILRNGDACYRVSVP